LDCRILAYGFPTTRLLLALIAYRIARNTADATRTYGFHSHTRACGHWPTGQPADLVSGSAGKPSADQCPRFEVIGRPMLIVAVIACW